MTTNCQDCYEYAGGLCPQCAEIEAAHEAAEARAQELPWELAALWADAPIITAPAYVETPIYQLSVADEAA